jgi:K+-sensing histidine kinase KdpD
MRKCQPNPELMLDSKTHSQNDAKCLSVLGDPRPAVPNPKKLASQLSIFPTATLTFVILIQETISLMQLIHFINKTGMKTAAGKLWTIPLMDAAIGGLVCALAAIGLSAAAEGHAWKNLAPLVFTAVLLVIAAVFGARAGILGTVLAALIFAGFLFGPVGSIQVANDSARANLGWMLLIGIGFSFLFAPPTSGIRRH